MMSGKAVADNALNMTLIEEMFPAEIFNPQTKVDEKRCKQTADVLLLYLKLIHCKIQKVENQKYPHLMKKTLGNLARFSIQSHYCWTTVSNIEDSKAFVKLNQTLESKKHHLFWTLDQQSCYIDVVRQFLHAERISQQQFSLNVISNTINLFAAISHTHYTKNSNCCFKQCRNCQKTIFESKTKQL